MSGVAEFFRWLNDAHGINLSIFYDSFDRDRFLVGLWTTLYLAVVCILLSLLIGIVGAWLQGGRSRLLQALGHSCRPRKRARSTAWPSRSRRART